MPVTARTDRIFALIAVALWAVALLAWSYAVRDRLPAVAAASGWPAGIARRAPPLARYDSGWYRKVADDGYSRVPPGPGETSEHAFFPLYPAIVRGLARAVSADVFAVGIFVSLACLAGAAVLFVAEGRRRSGEIEARRALIFLLLFPTAFFLASMYAEALFLLFALLAFASLARNRFAAAAAFGFLAGLTRLPALALVLPLGLTAAGLAAGRRTPALRPEDRALRTRRFVRAALVAIAPAAGVFLWIWAVGLWTGEPGIYFRIQRAWNRGSSPLAGLAQWAVALPMRLARGDARTHPGFVVDYAVALLFIVLAVIQARRRRWSDASWTAGALLLPAATGIAASVPRYLIVVYPAFFALEEVFRRRAAGRWIWWILSAALLLAGTAAFVNWRWVA